MERVGSKVVPIVFVVLMVTLVTLTLLPSPGTGDVDTWQKWADNANTQGPVAGYTADQADYPPLSSVILFLAVRALHLLGADTFTAVKSAILVFLFLTSLLIWVWTQDLLLALALHLALLLNSVALGYLDIFFAPSLLVALWALKERRLTIFTIFYGLACFTKWQPLIIAPFIIVYLLNIQSFRDWRHIDYQTLGARVLLPAIPIGVAFASLFGLGPLNASFQKAASHDFLSGNALNFNWILTHWLHVAYPGQFGGLVQGQALYIRTRDLRVTWASKLLFGLFYLITLLAFFWREKSYETLLKFSILGYLTYFMFNTGVHENHWFLALLLAFVLAWVNRDYLGVALVLTLVSNVNLILFYGIDGAAFGFSRVIGGVVDVALILAILNVGLFLIIWASNVFWLPHTHPEEPTPNRALSPQPDAPSLAVPPLH